MTTVSLPARCAVAVVCGEHPSPGGIPLRWSRSTRQRRRTQQDPVAQRRSRPEPGTAYELHWPTATASDLTRSLDDLGVEDGMTLVPAWPERARLRSSPQCESLSSALAGVGKRLFTPVTAETAAQTALAILGGVVSTVLDWPHSSG